MSAPETARRALRRLLVNGPLTGFPRRPADQDLLVALAAARFEPARAYRESEVNELLRDWLGTFCAPYGIDHVTMRRTLVDARRLVRDPAGATYRVNPAAGAQAGPGDAVDPAQVLAQIESERETRKRTRIP